MVFPPDNTNKDSPSPGYAIAAAPYSDTQDRRGYVLKNFGVTFPMFEHVDVKGKSAHPLFQHLAKKSEAPSWNFNKYLIVGDKVTHFGSRVAPENSPLEKGIKQSL